VDLESVTNLVPSILDGPTVCRLIKGIPGFGQAWLVFYVVQRRRQSVEQEARAAESISGKKRARLLEWNRKKRKERNLA
jgi:hypothetical protein